ncbi:oligopeptide transporter, OPT family [Salinisphaera sp. P385]|uniref:Oligopeptide transporter, OPT family n=1 Tax=Spectribacter acetivorans TaxID=3075603 RepID=A0ABU3BCG0_9GAMM|nr:oligopeptide transporter, OPT family [Salinisphaera sp. P385]MDT0619700.1 oligopeptide transporter, OPT family [Salinisphaera sp. P385]
MSQLTLRAALLGIVLAMILAGANAYLALFAGLTVSASIPAAVVSMAILRALARGSILENNIVQTAASAGESIAAGVIFTLPALVLLGYWDSFPYWWVVFIAGIGGLLGVLITVPLRHALIHDMDLPFPEGRATAEVLRAGHGQAGAGMGMLLIGVAVGGATKLAESGLRLWQATGELAAQVGQTVFYAGANLSPALLAVGYIVGFNIAVLVFAGGLFAWAVVVPLYALVYGLPPADTPLDAAWSLWSEQIRYMGVGAMLVGGLWALWSMRSSLVSGLQRIGGTSVVGGEGDLPRWLLGGLAVVLVVPMFVFYAGLLDSPVAALPLTVMMLVAAGLFSAVAAYMAGLVGSSNNPVSGVTIATILITALLLLVLFGDATLGPVAAILVGAVVCCAAAIGGDNMQDLKAGAILGAAPWQQQLAQMLGVVSSVCVLAPVLSLLLNAYGIGVPTEAHPDPLPAPQASLMAAVAGGVFGGDLPWPMVGLGALVAVALIVADEMLRRAGSEFRLPVLAVAVGIYLPLSLSVPIALGGLMALLARQRPVSGTGLLAAAGLITGEALMGIGLAVPIVVSGDRDVLAVAGVSLGPWPGLAIMLGLCIWLARIRPGVSPEKG